MESAARFEVEEAILDEVDPGSLFLASKTLPVKPDLVGFLGSNLALAMISLKRVPPLEPWLALFVLPDPFAPKELFADFGTKFEGLISARDKSSSSELPPLYCGPSSSLRSITNGFFALGCCRPIYGALNAVPAGAIDEANLPTFGPEGAVFVFIMECGRKGEEAGI
jgi:hypothetical protein